MSAHTERRRRIERGDVGTYLAFVAILLFFGGPLLWIISLSVRTPEEVFAPSLTLIPEQPTIANYVEVLATAQFPVYLVNSVLLAVAASAGAVAVAAPAAYAFSRIDFRGRRLLLVAVLALQMISPLVVMIPLYRYFANLGILNSLVSTAMVYVAIFMPLATWILKGFFDGIPKDLDEAALIDGCSRFGAFWRVIMPVAVPGVSAVFVLTAILAWGEFVVPYILLSEPSQLPISVGIYNFQSTFATTSTQLLAAGGVMAMLPAILVFVLMQRFIVHALSGAVKG